jgi:hypothetical protein
LLRAFGLLYVLQFAKENPLKLDLPAIKLEENEDVTEEAVSTSLKKAISRFSTLQAHDGQWRSYVPYARIGTYSGSAVYYKTCSCNMGNILIVFCLLLSL